MSQSFLKPADEKRKAILLLETLGLIHDLGKLDNAFIKNQSTECKVKHEKKEQYDSRDFFRAKLREYKKALPEHIPFEIEKLIGYMHGIAHFDKETEAKSEPEKSYETQPYLQTFISTPFGYDVGKVAVGKENGITAIRTNLPLSLARIHDAISEAGTRRAWFKEMREGMKKGIADTQRPINDVTLWEWGYLVASLTKAAARYLLFFEGSVLPPFEELPFQTLRVCLDKLSLFAESDKVTDLLGRKGAIDYVLSIIQDKIEFEWVLGNRIYHDETGDYYLLPQLTNEELNELKGEIRKIFKDELAEDFLPTVRTGERVTAKELDPKNQQADAIKRLIVDPREDSLVESPVHTDDHPHLFFDDWAAERPANAEICSVCGLRPVGSPKIDSNHDKELKFPEWATEKKARERHVCRVCLSRRGRRAEFWAETNDSLSGTTIWSDEVTDDRGKIALFVGIFGLKDWLNGSVLVSTRLSDTKAKNPSPSRLFRINETTSMFWKNVSDTFVLNNKNSERYRLRFMPVKDYPPKGLGAFHTYELEYRGITVSCVWNREKEGHFLSTENLSVLANRYGMKHENLLKKGLKPGRYSCYHPSSYGRKGGKLKSVDIVSVEYSTEYVPVIPLVEEPALCMSLLPADSALNAAETVIDRYRTEMNKIQDRLPMGIGLVFFPSRTPLRAVLEAGNAMRKMLDSKHNETWIVESNSNEADASRLTLKFDNGRSITYAASYGEETINEDPWYLWSLDADNIGQPIKISELDKSKTIKIYPGRFDFEFLDTSGRRFDICYDEDGKRNRRTRPFYLVDFDRLNRIWGHFRYLSTSQIHQVTNLIETKRAEWLTSGRRAEVKRDNVFYQFVQDTLANALWPKEHQWYKKIDEKNREELVDAGYSGELADLVELHMTILKSPLNEEQEA
ncbi:MAG: hypothetical protein HGB20_05830 [Chlorobiaceae bacterium]|nr:hypothetical protein [Chlorobiaceae bacterium]